LRVADWYVRLADGAPSAVVNETYGHIVFTPDGRLTHAPPATSGRDPWLPTQAERKRMNEIIDNPSETRVNSRGRQPGFGYF
jgi:hypothetical protein